MAHPVTPNPKKKLRNRKEERETRSKSIIHDSSFQASSEAIVKTLVN